MPGPGFLLALEFATLTKKLKTAIIKEAIISAQVNSYDMSFFLFSFDTLVRLGPGREEYDVNSSTSKLEMGLSVLPSHEAHNQFS